MKPDGFTEQIERARLLLDAGRPGDSVQMLEDDPRTAHHSWALAVLATGHLNLGAYDRAVATARGALALEPELVAPYLVIAGARLDQRQTADAIEAARTALSLAPTNPSAHAILARAHARERAFDAARHHARSAIELAPGRPVGWLAQAQVEIAAGRWDPAEEAARKVLALDPENEEGRVLLGVVQSRRSGETHRSDAIETLAATLRDNPDRDNIRRLLIAVVMRGNRATSRVGMAMTALVALSLGLFLPVAIGYQGYRLLRQWTSVPADVRRLVWADRWARIRLVLAAVLMIGLIVLTTALVGSLWYGYLTRPSPG